MCRKRLEGGWPDDGSKEHFQTALIVAVIISFLVGETIISLRQSFFKPDYTSKPKEQIVKPIEQPCILKK